MADDIYSAIINIFICLTFYAIKTLLVKINTCFINVQLTILYARTNYMHKIINHLLIIY